MNGHVEYDTAEIRRSARQVGSAANELDSVASELRRLAAEGPDALQGDAGTVLEDLLSKLRSDASKMSGGLLTISNRLQAFAAQLDELDRRAAANIRSH